MGQPSQEAEELSGGQAALSPELENQAHRQEEGRGVGRHSTVALSFQSHRSRGRGLPQTTLSLLPDKSLLTLWRVTKILKWVLGTEVQVSGLVWDLFLSGDALP